MTVRRLPGLFPPHNPSLSHSQLVSVPSRLPFIYQYNAPMSGSVGEKN